MKRFFCHVSSNIHRTQLYVFCFRVYDLIAFLWFADRLIYFWIFKVIWNQCEDPSCNQLRFLLTVNKDNFIEDLRFRVLKENLNNSTTVNHRINQKLINKENIHQIKNWNLEIRKFTHQDQACYQCQLNSYKLKAVHYCIKLQSNSFFSFITFLIWVIKKIHSDVEAKVIANPTRLIVKQGDQIKLNCHSDDYVKYSHIKWYHNGNKLNGNSTNTN